ncbi:hypothetical protein K474DRAFT_1597546, partial [Panus rudis PR-1116 ss-1]
QGSRWNPPRNALDLYTPRFVKGKGNDKTGLCPICYERPNRGGINKKLWFHTKQSAYNYHMLFTHGITPVTAAPMSPPVSFRVAARPNAGKGEKTQMQQGKCHKCKKWIDIEGPKVTEVKVKEIFWWKHASSCHRGSTISGECDIFVKDEYLTAALAAQEAEEDFSSSS